MISRNISFLYMKIDFVPAMSANRYKMLHYSAFYLGFTVCQYSFRGFRPISIQKDSKRYIRVGYNLDIMRQSACLVLKPITVYSYGFLFNGTTVGQASDSMTALT